MSTARTPYQDTSVAVEGGDAMRLIDADALLEEIKDPSGEFFFNAIHKHSVETATTIRCVDCRYSGPGPNGEYMYCLNETRLPFKLVDYDMACPDFLPVSDEEEE